MTNPEIAAVFEQIALILDLKGDENPFRIRAYDRAAQSIGNLSVDLRKVYEEKGIEGLQELSGIGKDLALKIEEMLKTGKLEYLDEIKKSVPPGLLQILEIEGMGPKRTKFVWQTFKVSSIDDLIKLAESGKLTELKGWGEKSVQNILRGVAQREKVSGRLLISHAASLIEELLEGLRKTGLCDQLEVAGSFRRSRETVGDLDILAVSKHPEKVMDAFCRLPQVDSVTAKGKTKSTVFLKAGLDADLRVVDAESFGAALLYFTGSKDHNVHIRRMGIKKNLTLSEYGLNKGTPENKGPVVAAKTEEDVYRAIGLPWITPELREDRGEIEAALEDKLPILLEELDIRSDLHLHSHFSDGSASMEEMAEAAKQRGYTYIAITDHASAMGMVKGIKKTGSSFQEYLSAVAEARKKVKGIHILAGAEVDITADGGLYLPDEMLKELDWVVASVHQHFHQTRDEGTARLIKVLSNPFVHTIGHPTGRLIGKREGIDVDMDAVLRAAKKYGKAMELNASAERLDLNDAHLRRAKELGVMITIGSDAHAPEDLSLRFGIGQARRGWIEKKDVMNTRSWEEFDAWRRAARK